MSAQLKPLLNGELSTGPCPWTPATLQQRSIDLAAGMLDGYILTTIGTLRGTHDSLEAHAYAALASSERRSLPRFGVMRAFSGLLGPDTLWALGRFGAERSRYNPLYRTGEAVVECQRLLRILLASRTGIERARSAGHLAHGLADLCDPAHHAGRPGVTRVRVFGRLRTEHWIDPLTGPPWQPGERHNHFEWMLARVTVPGTPFGVREQIAAWRSFFVARMRTSSIATVLHGAAFRVAQEDLWGKFLHGTPHDQLRRSLATHVIVPACGLIAACWSLAAGATARPQGARGAS